MKSRLIRFGIFLIIWIFGCYLADKVFMIGADAWRMLWGFAIGTIATEVSDYMVKK